MIRCPDIDLPFGFVSQYLTVFLVVICSEWRPSSCARRILSAEDCLAAAVP